MTEFLIPPSSFMPQSGPALPEVYTSIWEYRHPEREGGVYLVGMNHVGTTEFYTEVQEFVDAKEAEGAVVHQEGIKIPSEAQLAAATPRERRAVELLTQSFFTADDLVKSVGLAVQRETLKRGETWENHDIDDLGLLRVLGVEVATQRHLAQKGWAEYVQKLRLNPADLRRFLIEKLIAKEDKAMADEAAGRQELGATYDGLAVAREEILLAAADQHFEDRPDADLVWLWGISHKFGLERRLLARDYVLSGQQRLRIVGPDSFPPEPTPTTTHVFKIGPTS